MGVVRRHALTAGLAAATMAVSGATTAGDVAAAKGKKRGPVTAKSALRAFDSCGQIVRYSQRRARRGRGAVPPRSISFQEPPFAFTGPTPSGGGTPGGSPTPAAGAPLRADAEGDATSPTNVQEPGVDEPDLVKARGSLVFAAAAEGLHAVATDGTPRLAGSLPLDGFDHELCSRTAA